MIFEVQFISNLIDDSFVLVFKVFINIVSILNNSIHQVFIDNVLIRGDKFSTPKEVTPKDEISALGIREMFEDLPELETVKFAAQGRNQRGQGLKILTPQQMLSRLPISLAQLKAGNNSEKLKNEIRQLLYSLYRSKKLSKAIYRLSINPL